MQLSLGRHLRRSRDFPLQALCGFDNLVTGLLANSVACRANRVRCLLAEFGGARHKFATKSRLRRGQLVAELDSSLAERLAEANDLRAEVVVSGDDPSAIFRDLLGEKPNLAADFSELAEDFVAQRIESSAETGNRFDHEIEARAQFLEHRAEPVHRFVRH